MTRLIGCVEGKDIGKARNLINEMELDGARIKGCVNVSGGILPLLG